MQANGQQFLKLSVVHIRHKRESQNRINDFGPFHVPQIRIRLLAILPDNNGVRRNQHKIHKMLNLLISVILIMLFIHNGNDINKRRVVLSSRRLCKRLDIQHLWTSTFSKKQNSSLHSNGDIYYFQFASS